MGPSTKPTSQKKYKYILIQPSTIYNENKQ